jgi:hypothetical protein
VTSSTMDEILVNIKSILAPRTHGLSVPQIKSEPKADNHGLPLKIFSFTEEYADLLGTRLQVSNDQLVDMLAKCPGITNSYSTFSKQTVYHYKSAQTAHISNMNKSSEAVKQRISRPMNNQQRPRYVAPMWRAPAKLPLQPILENGQKPNMIEPKVPAKFVQKPQTEDLAKTEQNRASGTPYLSCQNIQQQQLHGPSKENYEPTAREDLNLNSIASHYHKVSS